MRSNHFNLSVRQKMLMSNRSESDAPDTTDPRKRHNYKNVAIIGGGLAGLSTAHHLLEKTKLDQGALRVTIFDKAPVGMGGASSVAGGYVRYYYIPWHLEHNTEPSLFHKIALTTANAGAMILFLFGLF
jgi:hypothetical protein